ncbi:granulocyte-macrophage colony-stimulating factor receptor subunit alpha-like [Zootoca vivipara]|uniref:granulocyte-macrophage colony-stimulating factor receptor subunit alpha-like n=1 Tax=Zootoca vivipara TaxID=8524 RepID=UPI00293C0362|nr:granulocyte-macrophage colony-stimulating factor receptor subunit alpha-like [Zootoca vivipara]
MKSWKNTGFISVYLHKKGKISMVPNIGFAHMSCLTVFCSVFFFTFVNNQGLEGTSAENLSCVIYTVRVTSMDCTWEAGRNISKDVQYFLYLIYHKNDGEEMECPQYKSNELGRHVGCHFPNVKVPENHITLRVNGSSEESLVQPLDQQFWPFDHEKLAPPQNITWNCHEQPWGCKVQWKPPPCALKDNSDYCFKYEIRDEIRGQISTLQQTHQNYTIRGKYSLRLRAAGQYCPIGTQWSDWSKPIVFGADPNPFPTVLLILVVLGTVITILLLILIWKRFHIWRCLTFPVPQPKDVLWQYENVKTWVDPTPAADEKITVVEEMNCELQKQ